MSTVRGTGRRGRPRMAQTVASTRGRKRGRQPGSMTRESSVSSVPASDMREHSVGASPVPASPHSSPVPPAAADEEEDEREIEQSGFAVRHILGESDEDKIRMRFLLEQFDDDQMDRYEMFRRANLNRPAIKKLASSILNQHITQNIAVVIAGFSKIFVGEIVELALDIQNQWGHSGPLAPDHLREAYRRYKEYSFFVQSDSLRRTI